MTDTQKPRFNPIPLFVIVIVVVLIILGKAINSTGEVNSYSSTSETKQALDTPDYLKKNPPVTDASKQKLEIIKGDLSDLESMRTATDRSTVPDLVEEAETLEKMGYHITNADGDTSKELKKAIAILKPKWKAMQLKEFPLLRKRYVSICADKLWEENITVTGSGRLINFAGGHYASNKNIKESYEAISSVLETLRFSTITFRWYKGANEYTYYTVSSKKDSE